MALEKELYIFNFSCLGDGLLLFTLSFVMLCTKLHTDTKGTEPGLSHAKFLLDFAFLGFFFATFFFQFVTNIFLNFVIE